MDQKLRFVAQPKTVSVNDITSLSYLFFDTFIDRWVSIQASHNFSNVGYPPCTDFYCTVADRLDVLFAVGIHIIF